MKPEVHATLDQKKYGGKISDTLMIHQFMDSSKQAYPTNLHRIVFHHSFGTFVTEQMFGIDYEAAEELRAKYNLPQEFIEELVAFKDSCTVNGKSRINSDGKRFSVRDIAEHHIFSDFRNRFIPTLQDYIEDCNLPTWVNNGLEIPNRLKRKELETKLTLD